MRTRFDERSRKRKQRYQLPQETHLPTYTVLFNASCNSHSFHLQLARVDTLRPSRLLCAFLASKSMSRQFQAATLSHTLWITNSRRAICRSYCSRHHNLSKAFHDNPPTHQVRAPRCRRLWIETRHSLPTKRETLPLSANGTSCSSHRRATLLTRSATAASHAVFNDHTCPSLQRCMRELLLDLIHDAVRSADLSSVICDFCTNSACPCLAAHERGKCLEGNAAEQKLCLWLGTTDSASFIPPRRTHAAASLAFISTSVGCAWVLSVKFVFAFVFSPTAQRAEETAPTVCDFIAELLVATRGSCCWCATVPFSLGFVAAVAATELLHRFLEQECLLDESLWAFDVQTTAQG